MTLQNTYHICIENYTHQNSRQHHGNRDHHLVYNMLFSKKAAKVISIGNHMDMSTNLCTTGGVHDNYTSVASAISL